MLTRKERSDGTSKSSPFKKSKQRRSSRQHANSHSVSSLCGPSANSVVSIPLENHNDDNTMVGSNTLYEWSVADNAPSIGSAGEIFLSEEQRRWNEMRRKHAGKTTNNPDSSSDEEDENDDDESQNLQFLQYIKLSDSPARCKHDLEKQKDADATPVRKTSNRGNNLISEIESEEKLPSPNNIKSRVQEFCTSPLSCPISLKATASMLTEGSSGPIDVDDLTEERQFDNIKAIEEANKNDQSCSKNCLSIELKGRIDAAYDDENEIVDNSYDEFYPVDSPSTVGSIDCSSMKNVGNENSPLHSTDKPTSQRMKSNLTRNIQDENETTFNMIRKQIHDAEPEFTFSISEEDLFASDDSELITATAWLLNDNDRGSSNDTSGFRLKDSKSNVGCEDVRGICLMRQKTSRTVMTEAAVVGDDDYLNAMSNTKKTNDLVSSNKGFMKMKSKLKSIVKKASNITCSDSHPEGKASSQLKKAKMKRDQSEVSLKPLTGIEDNSKILGKFRKDKVLAKEMKRRKYIEKLNVQKCQREKKVPVGKERLKLNTARRWMDSSGLSFSADFSDEETETPQASVPTKHDFTCVICQQNERTHLSIPCMHFSYCGNCVNDIEIKQCPTVTIRCAVCEEEVTKYSKVFY